MELNRVVTQFCSSVSYDLYIVAYVTKLKSCLASNCLSIIGVTYARNTIDNEGDERIKYILFLFKNNKCVRKKKKYTFRLNIPTLHTVSLPGH